MNTSQRELPAPIKMECYAGPGWILEPTALVPSPTVEPQYLPREYSANYVSGPASTTTICSPPLNEVATGKKPTVYRKRNDRHKFSLLKPNGTKSGNVPKDQGEAGRRYDQVSLMAWLQNLLLRTKPDLPEVAVRPPGMMKQGWKELKMNNISHDITDPLRYSKVDILLSSCLVLQDLTKIIEVVTKERKALESMAARLLQSKAGEQQLSCFLNWIAQDQFASRIAKANANLGSGDVISNISAPETWMTVPDETTPTLQPFFFQTEPSGGRVRISDYHSPTCPISGSFIPSK